MTRHGTGVLAILLIASSVSAEPTETHVTTYFDLKSAALHQGLALVKRYVRDSHGDRGNREVTALQELGRPNRFVVMETWRDPQSFEQHEQTSHTQMFRKDLRAIQRSPYDERVTHGFSTDSTPTAAGARALYVVTHVDVPGPKREDAETLLSEMAAPSRMQPGHIRYDIYQQNEPRMNHFTLFAIWNTFQDFDAYGSSTPWLRFRESLAPILGALYDERIYHLLR